MIDREKASINDWGSCDITSELADYLDKLKLTSEQERDLEEIIRKINYESQGRMERLFGEDA